MTWPSTITTERLILRPWRADDAPALFRYASDPRVGPAAGWPAHKTLADSQSALRDVLMAPETYAITIRDRQPADEPVGAIGLRPCDGAGHILDSNDWEAVPQANVGYWLGRPFWSQGYATEAMAAVERHAFLDLGLEALWADAYEGNEASLHVQAKSHLRWHHDLPSVRDLLGRSHKATVSRLSRQEWELALAADPTDAGARGRQQAEASRIIAGLPLVAYVRSGGQTGADRGGLDAAREAGVPICGWCPPGGLAEDLPGPPGVRALYPELVEGEARGYVERTAWNVRDSHATLIVSPGGLEPLSGTEMTAIYARRMGRPVLVYEGRDADEGAREALAWLHGLGQRAITLNVAGPRESKMPGTWQLAHDVVAGVLAGM